MSSGAMGYRSDIEGLRAVAILLVVSAHASVPGFEGGFIGVDIFFVISGYLITGILLQENQRNGRIRLPMFYARRARRLLPALALMLLLTIPLSWLLLPVEDQQEQAIAGAAATLWLSNLHFAFSDVGYFSTLGESNLYLHTWSLGVEEQFYIIWPLLMSWLLLQQKTLKKYGAIALPMGTLVVLGLGLSWWLTAAYPQQAFYLMPTRAWQFALGAAAFLASGDQHNIRNNSADRAASLLSVLGGVLILCGLALIDGDTPYPGWWSILPTAGTACLLLSGARSNSTSVVRLLSTRPAQFFGRISYSWYLWHWPLLILGGAVLPMWKPESRLVIVGFSVVMAVVSYRLLEMPLRRNDHILRRPNVFLFLVLAGMLLLAFFQLRWADAAFEDLSASSEQARLSRHYPVTMPSIYKQDCDDWYHSDALVPCIFGDADAKRTAIVFGDSVGAQWFPAIEKIFLPPEWNLIVLTKSACPVVDRPIHYSRIGREYVECATWRDRAIEYIARAKPDVLIMGSTHAAAYAQNDWIDGTRSTLSKTTPHAGEIFILRSTPRLPFNGAKCAESTTKLWIRSWTNACSAPAASARLDLVTHWIATAAAEFTNVKIVDMNDLVCPDGVCNAVRDGSLVFRDKVHLNAEYAASLSEQMALRMGVFAGGGAFQR